MDDDELKKDSLLQSSSFHTPPTSMNLTEGGTSSSKAEDLLDFEVEFERLAGGTSWNSSDKSSSHSRTNTIVGGNSV